MADEPNQPPQPNDPIPPPDGQGKKPEDEGKGAVTPPAKQPEAHPPVEPEKKFSQADVDRIVRERLQRDVKKGVRDELKKLSGDETPTLETVSKERDDANKKADDATARLRVFEAADQVEEFVADKRNNVHVRNMRGLLKFIKNDYEFDDDGKVTNLKELIAEAKRDAPEFFGAGGSSIDGGKGNNQPVGADMNSIIRAAAGR